MTSTEEKKTFVMKHVFTDIPSLETDESLDSERETHFNVEWYASITNHGNFYGFYLDCEEIMDTKKYKIHMEIQTKLKKKTGEQELFSNNCVISRTKIPTFYGKQKEHLFSITPEEMKECLINGNFIVEFHVEIDEMTGIEAFSVSEKFSETNKDVSDVVLMVEGHKFYVNKMFLAFHSSYFKALFFGNFEESGRSEVELKDINAWEFQNYLELIYGEVSIKDKTVSEILKLADFFDSKSAIRRCEEFLLESSQKTLKNKFALADKYRLDKLTEYCLLKLEQEVIAKNLEDYLY